MRHLPIILAGSFMALAGAEARESMLDVSVMVGGSGNFDACSQVGQIVGLDPKGDGFLSVRSGPGGKPYREIDRLYNGNRVFLCGQKGPWLAVVYGQSPDAACDVSTPWPVRRPYTGPCYAGWIHSRYVRVIAG
ncbi:integron [Microvirga sp. TS319]|uniref:integron n=1 Tax=Microvirga sp. TS319 TaxID=3241165 RepID=UPI00351A8DAD